MANGRAENHKEAASLNVGRDALNCSRAMCHVPELLRATEVVIPQV